MNYALSSNCDTVFHCAVRSRYICLVLRQGKYNIFTCEQNVIFQTDELSGLPDELKTSEGW